MKVEEQLKLIQQRNQSLQLEFKTTINKINEEKEIEKNKTQKMLKQMEEQQTIIKQSKIDISDKKNTKNN
jgi:hypothetical protein